jgi:hypothetical protein
MTNKIKRNKNQSLIRIKGRVILKRKSKKMIRERNNKKKNLVEFPKIRKNKIKMRENLIKRNKQKNRKMKNKRNKVNKNLILMIKRKLPNKFKTRIQRARVKMKIKRKVLNY